MPGIPGIRCYGAAMVDTGNGKVNGSQAPAWPMLSGP